MDYGFFLADQQFKTAIQQELADIKVMLAAIVDEASDKAAAKALAAGIAQRTKDLAGAIPASNTP